LKDLYILRGYPPATVIQWIKGSKEVAYKNRLDWVTKADNQGESERIWPLKSDMNPAWQKLNLGMVTEAMRRTAESICEEERATVSALYLREFGVAYSGNYTFVDSIWKWFGQLVASQKRPFNFGDKENKHNKALLVILGRHSKLALAGRSVDQREEDELMTSLQKYTLEDYRFTVTHRSQVDPFLVREV